ncbi:glycoside hydrolase [Spirochaetia bacterium]|nr:glycoside hydrolase [Spirochaetia bacterium]
MVSFHQNKILIDGKPVFLLAGELHYFRQPRENWQYLLDEAKAIGLNCISSYVPWILHEETEGDYCFEGSLDLGAFIDLCHRNGLYFFIRPGPYIMAEMKKEGLPYWVAKKHPDAVPVGFDGTRRPTNALDYLNEGYLAECRKWYQKIMQVIVPRLHCAGGNIIGVQLDNEVGMLNWITNQPLLNDHALKRFCVYLSQHYDGDVLKTRYPFDMQNFEKVCAAFRSPAEDYVAAFHLDYGTFMRKFYAEYVHTLKTYAEEAGIHDTPFFINIHGTGEGRIFDYPLGLSQLYEAYNQDGGMVSGTDVYLGEPTDGKYQDLYVANALTSCMNKKGNPLTSIEFECSDGPYCSLSGLRYHPSATSHKMLICCSQNARMLSFYVFAGGVNYPLKHPEPDGNERMAFTGEMHGYNAPVEPDGRHNYSFDPIAETARSIHALNELIASSCQKTDGVSMGFIPAYFLTEAAYPASEKIKEIYGNLKKWRCAGVIDSAARALLGKNICFDAVDVEHDTLPAAGTVLLFSARYMAAGVQRTLIDYTANGGNLLIYGELPEYDMEGNPCGLLLDALKLPSPVYRESVQPSYFLTLKSCGIFAGAAPEHTAHSGQCFPLDSDAVLSIRGEALMCGMLKKTGRGKICAITCDYPADPQFYAKVFEALSIAPSLSADYYRQGIYLTRTESADGQILIYIINLDAAEKTIDISLDGKVIFEKFVLREKASHILPLNVKAAGAVIVKSTAEITAVNPAGINFRLTQKQDTIVLKTPRALVPAEEYRVMEQGETKIIAFKGQGRNALTIRFA